MPFRENRSLLIDGLQGTHLLGEGVHFIGRDPNGAIYAGSEYISNEHAKLHLTNDQIDQLQKALPRCDIFSNPKK